MSAAQMEACCHSSQSATASLCAFLDVSAWTYGVKWIASIMSLLSQRDCIIVIQITGTSWHSHFLQCTHRMRSEFKTEKEHANVILGCEHLPPHKLSDFYLSLLVVLLIVTIQVRWLWSIKVDNCQSFEDCLAEEQSEGWGGEVGMRWDKVPGTGGGSPFIKN